MREGYLQDKKLLEHKMKWKGTPSISYHGILEQRVLEHDRILGSCSINSWSTYKGDRTRWSRQRYAPHLSSLSRHHRSPERFGHINAIHLSNSCFSILFYWTIQVYLTVTGCHHPSASLFSGHPHHLHHYTFSPWPYPPPVICMYIHIYIYT